MRDRRACHAYITCVQDVGHSTSHLANRADNVLVLLFERVGLLGQDFLFVLELCITRYTHERHEPTARRQPHHLQESSFWISLPQLEVAVSI